MNVIQTILIAVVEGLTEFLPISSTGHMILTQALLGIESTEFVKVFTVCIQFGAILSVIVLYFKRFVQSVDFYWKLFIAFLPAAVLGFFLSNYIDKMLESVLLVAIMLVVGGIFMLFVDKWFNKPSGNQQINWARALKIGLYQCIALIPGVSRSMATIVGGMSTKLTRKNAAEFSFFLAVPTMAAAAGYSLAKFFFSEKNSSMLVDNWHTILLGNTVAFLVAMAAIKFFIGFLTKYGFKLFGYYRIIVGGVILVLLMFNVNLNIL
jgi:undecaprenyl-diphosphatase